MFGASSRHDDEPPIVQLVDPARFAREALELFDGHAPDPRDVCAPGCMRLWNRRHAAPAFHCQQKHEWARCEVAVEPTFCAEAMSPRSRRQSSI